MRIKLLIVTLLVSMATCFNITYASNTVVSYNNQIPTANNPTLPVCQIIIPASTEFENSAIELVDNQSDNIQVIVSCSYIYQLKKFDSKTIHPFFKDLLKSNEMINILIFNITLL